MFLTHETLLSGACAAGDKDADGLQEYQCWLEALVITPEEKAKPMAENVPNPTGDGTHTE